MIKMTKGGRTKDVFDDSLVKKYEDLGWVREDGATAKLKPAKKITNTVGETVDVTPTVINASEAEDKTEEQ